MYIGCSSRYHDFYISKAPSYNSYKKLRAQNRTYDCVRVRTYLADFSYGLLPPCFRHGDGESQSALPRRGTKSHLILQSRRQVLLVVDEEGQFGAVRSGLSSIYMIRMGLRLVQMRGKKLQADDVMQRMPRSDLFFHLLFANSVQMGSRYEEPLLPPTTAYGLCTSRRLGVWATK